MALIQKIDKQKFIQKPPYSHMGSGLRTINNNHPLFLHNSQYGQGFADFLSNLIPKAASLISENKDIIGSVANSVGSVANAAKSISDTIKTSKELEKIKAIQKKSKNGERLHKVKNDSELTPEQIASLEKISMGQGFVKS